MSTQTPSRNAQEQRNQQPSGTGSTMTRDMPSAQSQNRDMSDVPSASARPMNRSEVIRGDSAPHSETKPAWRTTELYIYLAAVAGVLVASEIVGKNSVGVDIFRAPNAWLFITLLTIAYVVSRGLAKAGSSWRHGSRGR